MKPHRAHQGHDESGYTLIELMIAASLSLFILLPAITLFTKTLEAVYDVEARFAMNRQARQVMRILADGGISNAGTPGTDGTSQIYGLRAAHTPPNTLVSSHALILYSNGASIEGDKISALSITCLSANNPITGCISPGSKHDVSGWLDGDLIYENSSRSIAGRTTEISFSVIDPYDLLVLPNGDIPTKELYRTIFFHRRDEPDP